MSYVDPNYKTKKAFKDAVAAGVPHRPYNPSMAQTFAPDATVYIEGPHYPAPHVWYAQCQMRGGVITKVK